MEYKTKRGKMEEKKRLFLKFYAMHFNRAKASREVGISRPTSYNWEKDNKDFSEKLHAINQGFIDAAESVLYDTIQNGFKTDKSGEVIKVDGVKQRSREAIDAAKFVLARKGRDRGYVESIDINADLKAMQTKLKAKEEVIDVTPEEIKQLALKKRKK
jgi:hypothetical protein